ncbi:MAG: Farnesyl diphosphate synthase [Pseudomonadales bacterium]|nr:Farnesyl diphosphate synthase [Pseudomonadales bacterium]
MTERPAGPDPLRACRARAEAALDALFAGDLVGDADPRLRAAMRYSLLAGGKRLRPALLYAAADAVGGSRASRADTDRAACAIECIHTYSLIHDDLPAMDDDDLRRGVPTCHRAFDEATAILAGDALQALAFELLCSLDSVDGALALALAGTLARASGSRGMVGGQAIDVAHVGHAIDAATLQRMHELKTGALIGAALTMGAQLGGAGPGTLAAIDAYARALGLAFQVQDDVLDASGDVSTLGKTPGADAARTKPTYVTLLGERGARDFAAGLCAQALAALAPLGAAAAPLADIARFVVERDR